MPVPVRWVESCPLEYTSPNAPAVRDVLGTWLLSILDGQHRYAHINGLRGDAVAPQILGMTRIISDESLRRALKALAPSIGKDYTEDERLKRQTQLDKSTAWMDTALRESTFDALSTDWILDCDVTVKLLFGHQDGAEIGYNPTKPGRPSHNIHTYWVANLRMVLDAEVKGGKTHPAKYSLPGLMRLLRALPPEKRPELVRGDSAFGNDPVLTALESIEQMYLTKLRQTAGVKRLIERNWSRQDWQDVGQGSEAIEAQLKLAGWSHPRRVVVMRSAPKAKPTTLESVTGKKAKRQQDFHFDDADPVKRWDYAVLVTNSDYELKAIGQLYRDRADCENGFDELKNQWGWGGYTTQDLERCNLSARAVALIYNWWSWYVRLAHPATRLEAITSLAGRGSAIDAACWSIQTFADLDPCCRRFDKVYGGQCPQRTGHYSCNCATVDQTGTMVCTGALHRRKNHRRQTPKLRSAYAEVLKLLTTIYTDNGVTEEFRNLGI